MLVFKHWKYNNQNSTSLNKFNLNLNNNNISLHAMYADA